MRFLGCSKKPANSTALIQFSTKSFQGLSGFPSDQRLCFGFDISAEDIEYKKQSVCSPKKSLTGGFIASGGQLKADVPQGIKRQIDLYAYLLPSGDETTECPDWAENVDYSKIFKVGGTPEPIDLIEAEVAVTIEATFPGGDSNVKSLLGLTSCEDTAVPAGGFSNIQISSGNADTTRARAGDAITLTFRSDIPLDEISVSIFGNAVSIVDLGDGNYQVTYVLTGSEAEGRVSFILQHGSGAAATTTTTTSDGTSVILDNTAPLRPTALVRLAPANVIGTEASPVFTITGTEVGALVEIFSDASCLTPAGSATASSASTTVTASGLTTGIMHSIYGRQTDLTGNVSPCSAAMDRYAVTAAPPFVSTWQTIGASETITLPLRAGFTYNFVVDWGDGTSSVVTSDSDPDAAHIFTSPGTYTIILGGTAETLYFNNAGDKNKILTIPDLGDMGWTSFEKMFYGCTNLTTVAGGSFTSSVTDMICLS